MFSKYQVSVPPVYNMFKEYQGRVLSVDQFTICLNMNIRAGQGSLSSQYV
jgi:hypothetical protein